MKLIYLCLIPLLSLLILSVSSVRRSNREASSFVSKNKANSFYNYKRALVQLQEVKAIQKKIDAPEDEKSKLKNTRSQIKAMKVEIKSNAQLIKSLQALLQNTKDSKLEAQYAAQIEGAQNHTKTLQAAIKQLKKLETHLSDPPKEINPDDAEKYRAIREKFQNSAKKAHELRKEKEAKHYQSTMRFSERRLRKHRQNHTTTTTQATKNSISAESATANATTENLIEAALLAEAAVFSALSILPGDACIKQNASPQNSTLCPPGYLRDTLCRSLCQAGYTYCGTTCIANCPTVANINGYLSDWGNNCYHVTSNAAPVYYSSRPTSAPTILADSDSRVPCGPGLYKSGSHCYLDCGKINMQNCGTAICADSSINCSNINFDNTFSQNVNTAIINALTINAPSSSSPFSFSDFGAVYTSFLNNAGVNPKQAYLSSLGTWKSAYAIFNENTPAVWGPILASNITSFLTGGVSGKFTNTTLLANIGATIATLMTKLIS
jgi:cytochrome c556